MISVIINKVEEPFRIVFLKLQYVGKYSICSSRCYSSSSMCEGEGMRHMTQALCFNSLINSEFQLQFFIEMCKSLFCSRAQELLLASLRLDYVSLFFYM